MKVKFLVPEINKEKFNEDFRKLKDIYKFKDKDLSNIGVETLSTESIHRYGKDSIPTMDRLLTLCRYFNITPDKFLSAEPKWIECEVEDVSKLSIIGKTSDTYYVAPMKHSFENCKMSYKTSVKLGVFIIKSTIIYLNEAKEFDVEPGLDLFDDFHLRGKLYDKKRRFRIPQINIEKTNVKVNNYLYKYHLHSVDILTKLLGYNQDTSIKRLFEGSQTWAGRYPDLIYKLSWILDKPFEQLLVIDYHRPDTKANSEYATELLGKDRGLIFNHFYRRSEKERDYFLT